MHRKGLWGQDGSSLRAQGTLSPVHALNFISRFIPAGAGNTLDEPRVCEGVPCGSSLRAQGTRRLTLGAFDGW